MALGFLQFLGIEEYAIWDSDFANVVQTSGEIDGQAGLSFPTGVFCEERRELTDTIAVFTGGFFPEISSCCKALEHLNL